ncbi:SRPBCC family protein [Actinomycetospora termitidis]|uniref:SRPBCC family protein n=1 Tax=Actinomycetospora termitidis TaxID=3053470 RepID=A0ABT7MBG1_9PSEU|nr:SRPBCC family protein [Actinomycetospora sp. Odt1-22]MDL5157347.1 SRPBCC family protein [Actinomycetospora sp. Odt1-22]
MATRDITVGVDVDAPADVVWKAVTDWEGQSEWMLGTAVRVTQGDGVGVGSELAATTGVGPLGVTDTMRIVGWDPPHRATVVHTGSVVRGSGTFTVIELGPGRSRFEWGERLDLPLGFLGAIGWPLVSPVFRLGLVFSLRRLAARCQAER